MEYMKKLKFLILGILLSSCYVHENNTHTVISKTDNDKNGICQFDIIGYTDDLICNCNKFDVGDTVEIVKKQRK